MFSYIDKASNSSYALMLQLRETLVEEAWKTPVKEKLQASPLFNVIPIFEAELKKRLDAEVPKAKERYDKGDYAVPNRIKDCRTYPLYKFVRKELDTKFLQGTATRSPGQDIEKVFSAIVDGKLGLPLLKCLEGWRGSPGPFTPRPVPASPAAFNPNYWNWFDNARSPSAVAGKGSWSITG